MIPLYGFLRGDTLGLLILASEEDTVAELAERLVSAASVRVRPPARRRVVFAGKTLDPERKITHAGLCALDRFDVVGEED